MSRTPKEGSAKQSKLGCIDNQQICPVCTLRDFCEKTQQIREQFSEDHTLFLAHIQHEEKNPKPASPSTVANWVKEVMALADIDTTQFKAHSIRSAASIKAYMTEIGVPKLKQHTNWSLRTDTFERYYLRPPQQHLAGKSIASAVLNPSNNLTQKSTTSEVESESTTIGISMPPNSKVDEDETDDVVRSHPWYRRFF